MEMEGEGVRGGRKEDHGRERRDDPKRQLSLRLRFSGNEGEGTWRPSTRVS